MNAEDRASTTVSVIIPAYQAESYVGEAIRSALDQTIVPVEVIVVDDGSTDGTAAVAEGFGGIVQVVRQANAGTAAARNHGVRLARGTHLAFLDADDIWTPTKLEVQLQAFAADPTLELVFGHVVQFRSPELPPRSVALPDDADVPRVGHLAGTLLVRRETFDAIGPFAEDQQRGDFIDWFARALEQHRRILVLDEVTLRRRLHRSNLGLTARSGPEEYARVLRRVLDRRRRASTDPDSIVRDTVT